MNSEIVNEWMNEWIVSEAQSCTVLSHVFYFSTQEAVMSKKPFKHRKLGRSLSCWCGEQLLTTSMPTCSFTRLPMMRHQDTTALCSGSFCSDYLKITCFQVSVFLYSVFVRLWFLPILSILSLVSLLWILFFFMSAHKNITLSEHLIAYMHQFLLGVLGSLTFNRCLESFSLRTVLLICKLIC